MSANSVAHPRADRPSAAHELFGLFALAATAVAIHDLPFDKLPGDAAGLIATAGLTTAVVLALAVVGSLGAALALVLARGRALRAVLGAFALVALWLSVDGIERVTELLSDRETALDFAELYDDFHAPFEASFATLGVGALLALIPARRSRTAGRVGLALVGVALVGVVLALAQYDALLPNLSRALIDSDRLTTFAHKWIVTAFDSDGDGAPRFGGIDCDDADHTVNPMRAEVPGNGKDDNCLLGDAGVPARPAYARAPLEKPVKRVILFVWDTVRADHLPTYGYRRATAPNVDAFANDATVFHHVSSTAGMTRSYFAGLTSGRYAVPPPAPPRSIFTRVSRGEFERVENPDVSLFSRLGDAGVDRAACLMHNEAFVGFAPAWSKLECPDCGNLKLRNTRITAPILLDCVTKLAPQIDKAKPTLLLVHMFDPHARYRKHKGVPKGWGRTPMSRYDGEIWFSDKNFKEVLDTLAAHGLLEDAALVISADHGEGFFEHGRSHHGYTAYDENNRVPLIVRMPGQQGRRVVRTPIETGDISPTLLDLFGVPTDRDEALGLTGMSLVPLLANENAPLPRTQALGYTVRAPESSFSLTDWPHKVIWDRRLNLWELYDLSNDPRERTDLARQRADVLQRLKQELVLRVERHHL